MFVHRVKDGIVDNAVRYGVGPGNHTLMTGIGERREDALHSIRCYTALVYELGGQEGKMDPYFILFKYKFRFQRINRNQ